MKRGMVGVDGNRWSHSSRFNWKYRIENDYNSNSDVLMRLCKCNYVSQRTKIVCGNTRPRESLNNVGICEVHPRFFCRLNHLSQVEKKRLEEYFTNNDPLSEDDDETLLTKTNWNLSDHDGYNDLSQDDDFDPLCMSTVFTNEEVISKKLNIVNRKLSAVQDFRELIFEKAKRKVAAFNKKYFEQRKETPVIADEKSRKINKANKHYRWSRCHVTECMKRRLKSKLNKNKNLQHQIHYFKVPFSERTPEICSHVALEECDVHGLKEKCNEDEIALPHRYVKKNFVQIENKTTLKTTNISNQSLKINLPKIVSGVITEKKSLDEKRENLSEFGQTTVDDMLIVINVVDKLIAQVLKNHVTNLIDESSVGEISDTQLPTDGVRYTQENHSKVVQCAKVVLPGTKYCFEHIPNDHKQQLFVFCRECSSLAWNLDDTDNFCFAHIYMKMQQKMRIATCREENSSEETLDEALAEKVNGSANMQKLLIPTSPSNMPEPAKRSDIEKWSKVQEIIERNVSNLASKDASIKYVKIDDGSEDDVLHNPQGSSIIKPITRHCENFLLHHGLPKLSSAFASTSSAHSSEEDLNSCARTRPFSRNSFGLQYMRQKMRRNGQPAFAEFKDGNIYATYRSQESLSHSMVREILSGGSSKVSASKIDLIGNRRIPMSGSGFVSPTFKRTIYGTPVTRTYTEIQSQALNLPLTSSGSSQRSYIQRPMFIRGASDQLSSNLRQLSSDSTKYTVQGGPRPLPAWCNRPVIGSEGKRVIPVNAVSPMDYTDRSSVRASNIATQYIRRCDDRSFVLTGNARSRLVPVDSPTCGASRAFTRPAYSPYKKESRRLAMRGREHSITCGLAPDTNNETAAAIASISSGLCDNDNLADHDGSHNEEERVAAKDRTIITSKQSEIIENSPFESNEINKQNKTYNHELTALSRQSSIGSQDGLAVLAMAAASRAVDSEKSFPTRIRVKYGGFGLEEEDDDDD